MAVPARAAADAREWNFVALLDGKSIGHHRFHLDGPPGAQEAASQASFDVTFLGFPVYRYRLRAVERWRDGCLEALRSDTDDDGQRRHVDRQYDEGCVMSYAYWDPNIVTQARLVDPQTGELDPVDFERLPDRMLAVGDQQRPVHGWLLKSKKGRIRIWYSATSGRWVGLDAEVKDGHALSYRLAAAGEGSQP